MPSISLYIRAANYKNLRNIADDFGISEGEIINVLIDKYLQLYCEERKLKRKPDKS